MKTNVIALYNLNAYVLMGLAHIVDPRYMSA